MYTRRMPRRRRRRRKGLFRYRYRRRRPLYVRARPELKYKVARISRLTTFTDNTAMNDHFVYPVALSQGNAVNQRQGNKVYIKSLRFNAFLTFQPYTTTSVAQDPRYVRVVVGVKKRQGGTAPTISDLFHESSSAGPDYIITSPKNYLYMDNYLILFDRVYKFDVPFNFDSGSTGEAVSIKPLSKRIKFYRKFRRGLEVEWPNTGTAAEKNRVFYWAASSVGSSLSPAFEGNFVIRFTDY